MNAGEKSLLKALDQGGIVALVDQYGNYIYVNRRWEEDTGMTSDQVLGKNVEDVVSGSAAMLSLRTGRVISGEMFLRSKAGRELSSIMKYQPVFDEEKNVSGCLITSLFSRLEEAQDFSKNWIRFSKSFNISSRRSAVLPERSTVCRASSETVRACGMSESRFISPEPRRRPVSSRERRVRERSWWRMRFTTSVCEKSFLL
ncbi:MAG: PAS domain-containing protein [Anaerovoracaceae bacterium]